MAVGLALADAVGDALAVDDALGVGVCVGAGVDCGTGAIGVPPPLQPAIDAAMSTTSNRARPLPEMRMRVQPFLVASSWPAGFVPASSAVSCYNGRGSKPPVPKAPDRPGAFAALGLSFFIEGLAENAGGEMRVYLTREAMGVLYARAIRPSTSISEWIRSETRSTSENASIVSEGLGSVLRERH
jgi:hypothetical protein